MGGAAVKWADAAGASTRRAEVSKRSIFGGYLLCFFNHNGFERHFVWTQRKTKIMYGRK
jgi:hypothetical protein